MGGAGTKKELEKYGHKYAIGVTDMKGRRVKLVARKNEKGLWNYEFPRNKRIKYKYK